MKRSYYHYMETERHPNPKSRLAEVANIVCAMPDFPKQSQDYQELSHFLEMTGEVDMDAFDASWQKYIENN
ncbi:YozE family protein [Enterococcus hirae]|nr:YozE family protein [Enterococcaceae bacterium]MCI1919762.1 YozE family protein [Enterococcaceae bacterium]MDM8213748.1 YozE family protein [Enterococcus hirae]